MTQMTLYRHKGWGSALIEAQLQWYGIEVQAVEVEDVFHNRAARAELIRLNPAGQIPLLILPDGRRMTESAAMTLYLADLTGRDDLVPGPDASLRPEFLRWLIYFVAQIYPCFTFADDPVRYVDGNAAQEQMQDRIFGRLNDLWLALEREWRGPWFLGPRFSALDIYLAVMTRWEPGPEWFKANTPNLLQSAQAAAANEVLAPVFARNFDAD